MDLLNLPRLLELEDLQYQGLLYYRLYQNLRELHHTICILSHKRVYQQKFQVFYLVNLQEVDKQEAALLLLELYKDQLLHPKIHQFLYYQG